MTTTPTELPPRLREILTPTMGKPSFLDVRPRPDSEFNDCTEDIRRQTEEHGGSAVLGWTVWERPNAFLFTEFHTVWESPIGELLDVSAKADGEPRILFIPDSSICYTGVRIHGTHLPLTDDPVVLEHISAHEDYWEVFDRTYGADCLDDVRPTPEVAMLSMRRALAIAALDQHYP